LAHQQRLFLPVPAHESGGAQTTQQGQLLIDVHASILSCDHRLMMTIESPCVVSLTWTLADGQNRAIDELADPVEFFYGGDDLLAKVEEALAGHVAGESVKVHLEPEHAFGDYKAELVCFEDRKLFPADLETGMAFEGLPAGSSTPDMPAQALYIVTEIYPSHVVLDGNHPLAGMALRLDIVVRAVREATEAETEARSLGGAPLMVLGPGHKPPGGAVLH
jgi:FKBP-type peptidyl-prolyl cis-trans isomerase SlyD